MTGITFRGGPTHLKGQQINEGDFVPDFTVLDNGLNQVTLTDYTGKKKLISVVSSIDTGACDQWTCKFSSDTSKEEGIVLIISADLPLAQKRWCALADLDNTTTLSGRRNLLSDENYGIVMEGLRLLARAIFVLDIDNKAIYGEIVSEGIDFPGFNAALAACKNI